MKKTLYLIDFCNFSHSLFSDYWDKNGEHEKRAFFWLSQKAAMAEDEFNLYLDGSFRALGRDLENLKQIYCEGEKADERIKEQAVYCKDTNKRVIVVTDDGELAQSLESRKIKVIHCSAFYRRFS